MCTDFHRRMCVLTLTEECAWSHMPELPKSGMMSGCCCSPSPAACIARTPTHNTQMYTALHFPPTPLLMCHVFAATEGNMQTASSTACTNRTSWHGLQTQGSLTGLIGMTDVKDLDLRLAGRSLSVRLAVLTDRQTTDGHMYRLQYLVHPYDNEGGRSFG